MTFPVVAGGSHPVDLAHEHQLGTAGDSSPEIDVARDKALLREVTGEIDRRGTLASSLPFYPRGGVKSSATT
jgi:hypothetical protein